MTEDVVRPILDEEAASALKEVLLEIEPEDADVPAPEPDAPYADDEEEGE